MHLLLIRHATNDWVTGNRLAGWTPGVHLNDAGRAEAGTLAARLATEHLDAVYASPLERARETAGFVAAPHGLPVEVVDALGEVRYGDWTGMSLEDLKDDPLLDGARRHPSMVRFPGGESLVEVQARAVTAVETIRAAHPDGVVAAVTHADIVKLVVSHYCGLHLDMFPRLVVATASVTVLRFGKHTPRLLVFSDAGRLPLSPHSGPTV